MDVESLPTVGINMVTVSHVGNPSSACLIKIIRTNKVIFIKDNLTPCYVLILYTIMRKRKREILTVTGKRGREDGGV